MIQVIISVLTLSVLMAIIVLNASFTSAFNLFGNVFENIPVVAIFLISFVSGIVYSFAYFAYAKIRKIGKNAARQGRGGLLRRGEELKEKGGDRTFSGSSED